MGGGLGGATGFGGRAQGGVRASSIGSEAAAFRQNNFDDDFEKVHVQPSWGSRAKKAACKLGAHLHNSETLAGRGEKHERDRVLHLLKALAGEKCTVRK